MKETYELKIKQAQKVETKTKDGVNHYHVMSIGWDDISLRFKQPGPFPFPIDSSVKVTIETSQTKLIEPKKEKKKKEDDGE